MTYDANMAMVDLEIERLRPERPAPRSSKYQLSDTYDQDAHWRLVRR
jgi:hypothetical protein